MLAEVGRIRQQARRGVYDRAIRSVHDTKRRRSWKSQCSFPLTVTIRLLKCSRFELRLGNLLGRSQSLYRAPKTMTARLNVNIDHVATCVRRAARRSQAWWRPQWSASKQARTVSPSILRGDRRHIQDADVRILRQTVTTYLNLEMAATEEMLGDRPGGASGCSIAGSRNSR